MDNIKLKRITYKELKDKSYDTSGDNFGIISDYFIEPTREALLTNPYYDESKTVLNVLYLNGEIVGRRMFLPAKIKAGNSFLFAQTGGGLEIYEKFQGQGMGSMLVKDSVTNREYPANIGQLYSSGAISIFRKMDISIFEKPL